MYIIKLNAIASTNNYLKDLARHNILKNQTVVVANQQLKGRGQMNAKWESESGKNLLFSVVCYFDKLHINDQFYINYAVSNAVYKVLYQFIPTLLVIKWPNDILSGNKKIGGILIENKIKNDRIAYSIIGIGLNVNQEKFPKKLYNATSLKIKLGRDIPKIKLLKSIIKEIKNQLVQLSSDKLELLKSEYLTNLFRFKKPTMFITKNEDVFMGKITGVSSQGKLQITLQDESVSEFGLKEINFLKI